MTTLGFRYRIRQSTGVPRPSRAEYLEQAVAGWLSTLAWSDWTVTSPSDDRATAVPVPFMSIAYLQCVGMPNSEFRELNIMAFDGKPFYRELIDDEHGTNIYDEAIDRLWQTVQLLEITTTAAQRHIVFIDPSSGIIAFDEDELKTLPPLCLDQIPRLAGSLSAFRLHLQAAEPADLVLFETANFTIDEEWFDMMIHGANALDVAYRHARRRLRTSRDV